MCAPIAFLFDVDNTLLDNDRFEAELRAWLPEAVGAHGAEAYWQAFDARHARRDYVDYLGAVQDCRDASDDPGWLSVGEFLLAYPFAERLFPGALDLLAGLAAAGPVWLISDGDAVMQPHKLRRAGLWAAVAGRVRIFVHKETMLERIAQACPAAHHVLVDDKPRILRAVKAIWGGRVTTILPRQGHYARQPPPPGPAPDLVIDHIGELAAEPGFRALIARHSPGKETS